MNTELMTDRIETERLVLFPYTRENLAMFNRDLPRFEETYGVVYRGEELDYLLKGFLEKLENEIAADTEPGNIRSQNVLKRCGFTFLKEEKNLWWEVHL